MQLPFVMMYDVAIVGGGLAGLSLSIELAMRNHAVILFEKQVYPFHKVCGEYISNESLPYLRMLGIDPYELGAKSISKFRISTLKGTEHRAAMPLGGFGISRYALDYALARRAKELGVTLMDGTSVTEIVNRTLSTRNGDFTARMIVGAQGKRSGLDKQLERKFIKSPLPKSQNFIGVKYHVTADFPTDSIELHLFKDGYCGISAVEGDAYCMCYLSKASNLFQGEELASMENRLLSQNPVLRDYLSRFRKRSEHPEVISQINFQRKEKAKDGIYFVGDAAGLIAPLSGNGMSMAMHSAHLLCSLLSGVLDGKVGESMAKDQYQRHWNSAFGTRFHLSKIMQRVFFNHPAMEILMKSANFFPPLAQTIIRQTHGKAFIKEP